MLKLTFCAKFKSRAKRVILYISYAVVVNILIRYKKACAIVNIHWSICWLKKTENTWFDDVLIFFIADFVIVYIKMIIDFKNFLFAFPWRNMVEGTKQITKVWRSIFSTVLVTNAVQNETLKN